MTEKDIKPIPRYIMDKIYRRDLKIEPWQTSTVRYYAYLTVWKKELIKVTAYTAFILRNVMSAIWSITTSDTATA